jgi:hypothetical protein
MTQVIFTQAKSVFAEVAVVTELTVELAKQNVIFARLALV